MKTGIITIVKPYKGSPAYDAGLLPNDIIYKVEGEEVTGEDLTEVVSKIKGKEGTEVNITIYRDGVSEPMEFTIIRQKLIFRLLNMRCWMMISDIFRLLNLMI